MPFQHDVLERASSGISSLLVLKTRSRLPLRAGTTLSLSAAALVVPFAGSLFSRHPRLSTCGFTLDVKPLISLLSTLGLLSVPRALLGSFFSRAFHGRLVTLLETNVHVI